MSNVQLALLLLIGALVGLGIEPKEAVVRGSKSVSIIPKSVALKAETKIEPVCTGDTNDANWLYPVSANEWKYFEGGMLPYRVTCG